MWIECVTRPRVLRIALALMALATPAVAQQTVCGEAEYAGWLRNAPPTAEHMRFPPPPGGRLDTRQSIGEAYPRRAFSQTFVYRMPQGTPAEDVIGCYRGPGPAADGPPPGWKPPKWKGGRYRGQVEPLTLTGTAGER